MCTRTRAHAALALVATLGFTLEASAEVEFHPRGTVSASWVDNISLVAEDDPAKESSSVFQLRPGFFLEQRSQRFNSSVDYELQYVMFGGESDRNASFHLGEAELETELVSRYLFFDAGASYGQQILDARKPTNNNNLFQVLNQTDALMARANIALRHDFDAFLIDARYGRGIVEYKEETDPSAPLAPIQDAETETRTARIASVDEDARLTWEARYEMQQAEYDLSLPYRFEQASAELGALVARPLRLIGRYGLESDPLVDASAGGLDSEYWEAGFRYAPGERTRFEAFYGDRFYGESFSAYFRHEARRALWTLTYLEGPMTEAQEMALRPLAPDEAHLAGARPDAQDFARQTSAVYLRKTAEGRVVLTGQRTTIDISVLDYRRDFLDGLTGDEHFQGGTVAFTRNFSAQTSLLFSVKYNKSELLEGDSYRETIGTLELTREIGRYFTGRFGVYRIDRSGSLGYASNWVTASITAEL